MNRKLNSSPFSTETSTGAKARCNYKECVEEPAKHLDGGK